MMKIGILLLICGCNVLLAENAELTEEEREHINKNRSAIENVTYVNSENLSGNIKITTLEILPIERQATLEDNEGFVGATEKTQTTADGVYETTQRPVRNEEGGLLDEQLLQVTDVESYTGAADDEGVTDDPIVDVNTSLLLIDEMAPDDDVEESELDKEFLVVNETIAVKENEKLKDTTDLPEVTDKEINVNDNVHKSDKVESTRQLELMDNNLHLNISPEDFNNMVSGNLQIVGELHDDTTEEKVAIVTAHSVHFSTTTESETEKIEVVTSSGLIAEDINETDDSTQIKTVTEATEINEGGAPQYSTEINVVELIDGEEVVQSLQNYKQSRKNRKLLVSDDKTLDSILPSMSLTLEQPKDGFLTTTQSPTDKTESLSNILGVNAVMMEEIQRDFMEGKEEETTEMETVFANRGRDLKDLFSSILLLNDSEESLEDEYDSEDNMKNDFMEVAIVDDGSTETTTIEENLDTTTIVANEDVTTVVVEETTTTNPISNEIEEATTETKELYKEGEKTIVTTPVFYEEETDKPDPTVAGIIDKLMNSWFGMIFTPMQETETVAKDTYPFDTEENQGEPSIENIDDDDDDDDDDVDDNLIEDSDEFNKILPSMKPFLNVRRIFINSPPKQTTTEETILQATKDFDEVPHVTGMIYDNVVNFSVTIMDDEEVFHVPHHSALQVFHDIINITWKSSQDNLNNSLAFYISEKEDLKAITQVELTLVKDNDLLVIQEKTNIDTNNSTMELQMEDNRKILVSNLDFLRYLEANEDIMTASSESKRAMIQLEIVVICVAIIVLIAATLYLVLKKNKQKSNTDVKEEVATA